MERIDLGILIGAALLYAGLVPHFQTGVFNDDAVYVIAAKDLWNSSGKSLYDLRPDFPLPGIPLLLAPAAALVRPNWRWLEWMSWLISVLSVGLLSAWTRKWLLRAEALVVVTLFAFNPMTVRFSGIILPAAFYTCAVIAVFFLMQEWIHQPTWGRSLALGFLLGWAAVLRPEGALLTVCVAGTLLTLKWKETLYMLSIPSLVWILVLTAWHQTRVQPILEFHADMSQLMSYWLQHPQESFWMVFRMARLLMLNVLLAAGWSLPHAGLEVCLVIILCGFALMVMGFRSHWKRRDLSRSEWVCAVLFCGMYAAVHVFWRVEEPRYLLPLLPFLLILIVRGTALALQYIAPVWRKWLSGLLLASVFVSYSYNICWALYETHRISNPQTAPPWQTLQWVDHNTAASARFLSAIAPSIALYGERYATGPANLRSLPEFLSFLRAYRLDHVVDRSMDFIVPIAGSAEDANATWLQIRRWFVRYPRVFVPIYQNGKEETRVFRIESDNDLFGLVTRYLAAARAYLDGRQDEALVEAQACVQRDPRFGAAQNLVGAIYARRGDFQKAEAALVQAVQRMPDSPVPLINLASMCHALGAHERSMRLLKRGMNLAASNGHQALARQNIEKAIDSWQRRAPIYFIESP